MYTANNFSTKFGFVLDQLGGWHLKVQLKVHGQAMARTEFVPKQNDKKKLSGGILFGTALDSVGGAGDALSLCSSSRT